MRDQSEACGAVTVAYIHGNVGQGATVSHSWHLSLMETVAHDLAGEMRLMRGGWIAIRCGTDGLADARNKGVRVFLDERESEWLWWLDTDMGFRSDALEQLVNAADPVERPVIGALCFAWKEVRADDMGGYETAPRPTIFDWRTVNGETGFLGRSSYAPDSLVQCGGTGAACILIHRSVLERMRKEFGDNWYTKIPNPDPNMDDRIIGEDLSFCMRLAALGIPLFVHTGVRTTHHKDVWVSEDNFIQWSLATEALKQAEDSGLIIDESGENDA